MPGKKKIGIPREISKDTFRVAKSDNKIKLFAKFNHKWYATPLQDAFEITNQHQKSANSILTFIRPGEGKLVPTITAKDGALNLLNNDKSEGIMIKQVDGVLQVRHHKDSTYGELYSGDISVGSGGAAGVIKSQGNHDITIKTGNSTTGSISIVDGTAGAINIAPNGAGTVLVGGSGLSGKITSRSGQSLELYTLFSGSSKILINGTADGDIDITTNGSGKLDIDCETVPTVSASNQWGTVADQKFLIIDETSGAIGYRTAEQLKGDVAGIAASSTFSDITISATDGNTALQVTSSADTGDLFKITTTTHGATTIATIDDDATAANLTLDVDGDVEINADGGTITFKDALVPMASFGAGRLDINKDLTSYTRITVATNGTTTLATTDGIPADADFILDAGGDIALDSGTGIFIAKKAGTEFSAANSSYAGMILGYTAIGIDTTTATYAVTASYETIHDGAKVTFKAPPSGNIEIFVSVYDDIAGLGGRPIFFGLSDQDTTDTYQAISFPNATDITNEHEVHTADETDEVQLNHIWVVTDLVAGTSYTWWIGAKASHISTHTLKWGGRGGDEYGPFIIKATALPATVYDGT